MSNESGSSGCLRNLIIIFAVGGGLLWCSGNNFRQQVEKAETVKQAFEDDTSWIKSGFSKYNNELAAKYITDDITCNHRYTYPQTCIQIEVLTRYGCNNLYAQWSLLDKDKRNIGYTNDATTNVKAGQIAVLEIVLNRDRGVESWGTSKITCY